MDNKNIVLPELNCGVCGFKTCNDLSSRLETDPDLLKRCIHLSSQTMTVDRTSVGVKEKSAPTVKPRTENWIDSLSRPFDFYLEHFESEPGPREIIIPHNPMITRELDIQVGEVLMGRPLGISCGCPITHCGIVMSVDKRTGVIVWCVTGPLDPRTKGFKDLGYYIAEGYEGMVKQSQCELKIGMRYYFQPRMCMLQWRHSGLVNFMNKRPEGIQIRVEGLFIG
jgi:uncharacterized Fe-S cluster-containing protein